jgi:predicted homoserine dehydrogenase-like protein
MTTFREPRYDVIYRALKPLKAGEAVGHDHSPELTAEMIPAVQLAPDSPLPGEMARGNRLLRDVPAGAVIIGADVVIPSNSILRQLRHEQEQLFPE